MSLPFPGPYPTLPLPPPCPLQPEPEDARHVCEMYGLTPQQWAQLVAAEWRNIRACVRPEVIAGTIPPSFHVLPVFLAHSVHSPNARRRQAASWAIADILQRYMSDDE